MNGLKPFGRTIEQTTETLLPSPKTITASVMTTNRITSLRELLHYRGPLHSETFHIRETSIATMGDKRVETLGSKILFLSILFTFPPPPPLPPKTMLILFLRLHRPQRLHDIELGGRGDKRINARCT